MSYWSEEQIEKTARAIHRVAMISYPGMPEDKYGWDVQPDRDRTAYLDEARAALASIEKPSVWGPYPYEISGWCGICKSHSWRVFAPTREEAHTEADRLKRKHQEESCPTDLTPAELSAKVELTTES